MTRRVLVLGGSLAVPSHTGALLREAERVLVRVGAEVERWDVRERPLPPLDPAEHALPLRSRGEASRSLAAEAAKADALVVASPLYHNSCSGAVKNVLDHLAAAQVSGKPVALLGHGGRWPSSQALDHLRLVSRALGAVAIPMQVATADGDWVLDHDEYALASAEIQRRLETMLHTLLGLVEALDDAARETSRSRPHGARVEVRTQ